MVWKNNCNMYYDDETFDESFESGVKRKKRKKFKMVALFFCVMLICGLITVNINMSKTAKKNTIIDIQKEQHGKSNVIVFYFGNTGYYLDMEPLIEIKEKIIKFHF